ncbi:MAG: response regulator [Nitrospiraceae bacterium]|nr:response regulator [Nitrospiraceae bacterium]
MRLTLRTKTLIFIIPVLIIVSSIYTYNSINSEKEILKQEIIKRGETVTTLATRTSELPIVSGNNNLLKNAAISIAETPDVNFISLYDKKFKQLIHYGAAFDMSMPQLSLSEPLVFHERPDLFIFYAPVFTVRTGEDIEIFEAVPKKIRENIGWIRIGFSKSSMKEAENKIVVRGMILALIFTLLSSIIAYILMTIAIKPLTTLLKAVKKLREGKYQEIKDIKSSVEIAELTIEFNKMSHAIKEREDKLIESERKISNLFERTEHAIFRLNKDSIIIESNRKFDEFCRETKKFHELLAGGQSLGQLKNAAAGEFKNVEVRIIGKNNALFIVLMSLYPEFTKDNNLAGFDGYFIDITEKRRLEETIVQAQKMESLGLFAGGVAHDFNNILTAIVGYGNLLLAKLNPADQQLHTYVSRILTSSERAANLTKNLLAFSRKQVMQTKPLDLNDSIKNVLRLIERIIGEDVEINIKLTDQAFTIMFDPTQLEQIIMNLSTNARDALPKGGLLSISTSATTIGADFILAHGYGVPGEYALLTISDNGSGMDKTTRDRIFEPFFTTKQLGKGTGLGLSIVYGIIKQNKSFINVYSEIGIGTTFRIYIPLIESAFDTKSPAAIDTPKGGNETILLAEDEETLRTIFKDILEKSGYTVISAKDGEDAIHKFQKHKENIKLLILDVLMPKLNGKEVHDKARELKPDIEALFISGYPMDVLERAGFSEKDFSYISKPFSPNVLLMKVRDILDKKKS